MSTRLNGGFNLFKRLYFEHKRACVFSMTTCRDNHAEGIVFSKRLDIGETFNGGERASKSNLKTYSRNLEKNIFCSEIYDFVIKFS